MGVEAAAIEARTLMLSWTARCCLSMCVVGFNVGKLNIESESSEKSLLTAGACVCDCCCCCCCWLSWISASSIEDDVDDDADDDDCRFVDADEVLLDDGFAGGKSAKIKHYQGRTTKLLLHLFVCSIVLIFLWESPVVTLHFLIISWA